MRTLLTTLLLLLLNSTIYTLIPPAIEAEFTKIEQGIENVNQYTSELITLQSQSVSQTGKFRDLSLTNAQCKFYGYWDSASAPDDHVNIWKEYISQIDRVRGKGTFIPMISGFKPGMSDAKIRQRIELHLNLLKDSDDIEFILLHDEPFLKGFSAEDFNRISNIASEYPYRFGWSLSDNKVNSFDVYNDQELVIAINTYLFFHQDYGAQWITTREEFIEESNRVFNNARKKFPNAKFVYVGQAFKNSNKYRQPPLESVQWTAEFVQNNPDIIGILWFEWRDRNNWQGAESMPEFVDEVRRVF